MFSRLESRLLITFIILLLAKSWCNYCDFISNFYYFCAANTFMLINFAYDYEIPLSTNTDYCIDS